MSDAMVAEISDHKEATPEAKRNTCWFSEDAHLRPGKIKDLQLRWQLELLGPIKEDRDM